MAKKRSEPTSASRPCPVFSVCPIKHPGSRLCERQAYCPLRSFWAILTDGDILPTELFLGVLTLCWGVWFLCRSSAFELVPTYLVLRNLCDYEWAWGLLFVVIGLSRLAGTALRVLWLRKTIAFWGCLQWVFLSMSVALSTGYNSAGSATLGLIAVASAWVYWRLPACSKRT